MNIAVLGASSNKERFSNKCLRAYLSQGHTVYPVHPSETTIEGQHVFHSLQAIHHHLDVVAVYVRPEVMKGLLDELIAVHPPLVYLNPGTEDEYIEGMLVSAGIVVKKECAIRAIGADPAKL